MSIFAMIAFLLLVVPCTSAPASGLGTIGTVIYLPNNALVTPPMLIKVAPQSSPCLLREPERPRAGTFSPGLAHYRNIINAIS